MRKLVKEAEDAAIPILGPGCKSLHEAERDDKVASYPSPLFIPLIVLT